MSDSYWDDDQVRSREQDEVDRMPTLPAAAARVGISPRQLQEYAAAGWLETHQDRSGRERVDLDQAEFLAELKSGRLERYLQDGRTPIQEDR